MRALQVEVTSSCNRSCAYCPRHVYRDRWKSAAMAPDVWAAIAADLHLVAHLHLQGWGEPLLHRDLPMMVRQAKDAGCSVGLTTNGDLLAQAADWIMERELDLVSISIAGADAWNPTWRNGASFAEICQTIRAFQSDNRVRRHRVKLQVGYLLTEENAAELPEAIGDIAAAGADACYVIHLDFTPSSKLFRQTAFQTGVRDETARYVRQAEKTARAVGIEFRPPAMQKEEVLTCALNPRRFAFVSVDGRVGPCVNLLLPIDGSWCRVDDDGAHQIDPYVYGDLRHNSLDEILASTERSRFIEPFDRRLDAEHNFIQQIPMTGGSDALRTLDRADAERQKTLEKHPFPQACAGCHKRWGW